jgi:hypothetical protein
MSRLTKAVGGGGRRRRSAKAVGATVETAPRPFTHSGYSLEQVRGTGEYDYAACQQARDQRLVYAPSNGQWFARDQAFAKGGSQWGSNQRKG